MESSNPAAEYKPVYKIDEVHHVVHICAWCDADKKITEEWHDKGWKVGHGMCPKHAEEVMKEAEAMPQEARNSIRYRYLMLMIEEELSKQTPVKVRVTTDHFRSEGGVIHVDMWINNEQADLPFDVYCDAGEDRSLFGVSIHNKNGWTERGIKAEFFEFCANELDVGDKLGIPVELTERLWKLVVPQLVFNNGRVDLKVTRPDSKRVMDEGDNQTPGLIPETQVIRVAALMNRAMKLHVRREHLMGACAYICSRMMNAGGYGGVDDVTEEMFTKVRPATAEVWEAQFLRGYNVVNRTTLPATPESEARVKDLMLKHGLAVRRHLAPRVMDEGNSQWDAFTILDFITVADRDAGKVNYFLVKDDFDPRKMLREQSWINFSSLGAGVGDTGNIDVHPTGGMDAHLFWNSKFPTDEKAYEALNQAGLAWLGDYFRTAFDKVDYPSFESQVFQMCKDHGWQLAARTNPSRFAELVFPSRQITNHVMDESRQYELTDVARYLDKIYWIRPEFMGLRFAGHSRFVLAFLHSQQVSCCGFCPGLPPAAEDYIHLYNEPARNTKDPVLLNEAHQCPVCREILAASNKGLTPSQFLKECLRIFGDANLVPSFRDKDTFVEPKWPRKLTSTVADESVFKADVCEVAVGLDVEVSNAGDGPSWVPAMILKETKWMDKRAWHVLLENGDDLIRVDGEIRPRIHNILSESHETFEPGERCLWMYHLRWVPAEYVKKVESSQQAFGSPVAVFHHRIKILDGSTVHAPGTVIDTHLDNVVKNPKRSDVKRVQDESLTETLKVGDAVMGRVSKRKGVIKDTSYREGIGRCGPYTVLFDGASKTETVDSYKLIKLVTRGTTNRVADEACL